MPQKREERINHPGSHNQTTRTPNFAKLLHMLQQLLNFPLTLFQAGNKCRWPQSLSPFNAILLWQRAPMGTCPGNMDAISMTNADPGSCRLTCRRPHAANGSAVSRGLPLLWLRCEHIHNHLMGTRCRAGESLGSTLGSTLGNVCFA